MKQDKLLNTCLQIPLKEQTPMKSYICTYSLGNSPPTFYIESLTHNILLYRIFPKILLKIQKCLGIRKYLLYSHNTLFLSVYSSAEQVFMKEHCWACLMDLYFCMCVLRFWVLFIMKIIISGNLYGKLKGKIPRQEGGQQVIKQTTLTKGK